MWGAYYLYGALHYAYTTLSNDPTITEVSKCQNRETYDSAQSECRLNTFPLLSSDRGFTNINLEISHYAIAATQSYSVECWLLLHKHYHAGDILHLPYSTALRFSEETGN